MGLHFYGGTSAAAVVSEAPPAAVIRYVDLDSGSDSADGLTTGTAWRTQSKGLTAIDQVASSELRMVGTWRPVGNGSVPYNGVELMHGIHRPTLGPLKIRPWDGQTLTLKGAASGTYRDPIMWDCTNVNFDGVQAPGAGSTQLQLMSTLWICNGSTDTQVRGECTDVAVKKYAGVIDPTNLVAHGSLHVTKGCKRILFEDGDQQWNPNNWDAETYKGQDMITLTGSNETNGYADSITVRRVKLHDYMDLDGIHCGGWASNVLLEDVEWSDVWRVLSLAATNNNANTHIDLNQIGAGGGAIMGYVMRRCKGHNYMGTGIRGDASGDITGFRMELCDFGPSRPAVLTPTNGGGDFGSPESCVEMLHFTGAEYVSNTLDGLKLTTDIGGLGTRAKVVDNIIGSYTKGTASDPAVFDYNAVVSGTLPAGATNTISTFVPSSHFVAVGTPGPVGAVGPGGGAGVGGVAPNHQLAAGTNPAVNAGVLTSGGVTAPTTDILGTTRSSPPDVGAFER